MHEPAQDDWAAIGPRVGTRYGYLRLGSNPTLLPFSLREFIVIKKSVTELNLVIPKSAIPTIEVDLDSIPDELFGYSDLIIDGLQNTVRNDDKIRATVYVYQGSSVNFHTQTFSAFIGVAGSKKILDQIYSILQRHPKIKSRYSDYIDRSSAQCELHIQDGLIWQPEDRLNWFSSGSDSIETDPPHELEWEPEDDEFEMEPVKADEEDEFEEEELDEDEDESVIRTSNPSRYRAARSDARLKTIKSKIEQVFGLPEGSVLLCGPDGKALRSNAKIATLRKRWEWNRAWHQWPGQSSTLIGLLSIGIYVEQLIQVSQKET